MNREPPVPAIVATIGGLVITLFALMLTNISNPDRPHPDPARSDQ